MTTYGYIAGYLHDPVCKQDSLKSQLKTALTWNLDFNNIFADKFTAANKARYNLNNFLANAKEGDILIVPSLNVLYSNPRELCSLMQTIADKGIRLKSSDLDYGNESNIESWVFASQLSHLSYINYLHKQYAVKTLKKRQHQLKLNTGGRNKRVITRQYQQAYEYLQSHTYHETEAKFHLSKSTLYRIKKQVDGNQ
ncbi:recombinase family protein [Limosilactobacillus sp. RRLNB_1_1]|uniref:Recombinase family protein n=1 Tax=Limosilactobacillus albertensis TaxID=2759752 RepID=A0A7W3Y8D6_9LACO|nr:recombinase family protein [Limosilactobacillus albertensis]MBB1069372.1 recombinase family protein [Limosilactobacillus albertensis]MCD7118596.1 recombinase family protein [Limosilactobacillus albertensis]MCD7128359.1 recombinase family protein [Limosilactobacillus albertensis]